MTWAASHKWGGCSGRAAIYAIANHANDLYFCWARQETLAEESEQSTDSVGRRIGEFVASGEVRRIKLRRFGRRTHDFLILKPSPYFAAPIEDIEQFIPRGCDIMDDAAPTDATAPCGSADQGEALVPSQEADSDATATCGSAESGTEDATLPQPAAHATALVRQQEPLSEPKEDSPPTPPLGGRSKNISDDKRASFERFAKAYPAPIVDYEATLRLWASMTDADNEDAIKGVRGYARYLADLASKGRTRNVKDAHRWLRNKQWIGFLTTAAAEQDEQEPTRVWVLEDSDDAAKWAVFNRICGRENRFINGRMLVPTQRPPPVGDGRGCWIIAVEGTGQFAAWLRRLREGGQGVIGLRQFKIDGRWQRGLMVPTEWPPPRYVAGTLCTEEDLRELARG
jgi:hypothetical protein